MIELYKTYYHLKRDPFRLSPDHYFVYAHPSYKKSLAYLKFAAYREEGFVMITGKPGTGKTTLINEIISTVDASRVLIFSMVTTQLEATDLLQMVASSFNIHTSSESKASLLIHIEKFLKFRVEEGKRVILIVDEAQALKSDAVEELRLLSNLMVNGRPMLQIFLVGQDELRDLIITPEMEQLRQRLVATSLMEPLNEEEVTHYVQHRLDTAGWTGDPKIENAVMKLVYHYSGGVPRRINLICGRMLLNGCMEEKHELTRADMVDVLGELKSELLIFDDETLSDEDIIELAGVSESFLEPLNQPRAKSEVEQQDSGENCDAVENLANGAAVAKTVSSNGAAVVAVDSNREAAAISQPAASKEPPVFGEPDVELHAGPRLSKQPENDCQPRLNGSSGQAKNEADDSAGIKPGTLHGSKDQDYGKQSHSNRIFFAGGLRVRLLVAGCTLIIVLALFIFQLMSGYISSAIDDEVNEIARQVAVRMADIERYYGSTLIRLAQDPQIKGLFKHKDVDALGRKEESLKYMISQATNIRLLLPGTYTADMNTTPPLSYSAIAQLRAAETSDGMLPMEVHLYNKPQQHISMVHRVNNEANGNAIGLVRMSLSKNVINELVDGLQKIQGYIEIQQVGVKGNPVAIASYGERESTFGEPDFLLPFNKDRWQVAYWPAESVISYLTGVSLWVFGALLLSTVSVMLLIVIVLYQRN